MIHSYVLTNTVASHAIPFLLANGATRIIGSGLGKEVADEATNFKCTRYRSGGRDSHGGCSAESDESEEELSRLHVCC
jgi:hypothetical protein